MKLVFLPFLCWLSFLCAFEDTGIANPQSSSGDEDTGDPPQNGPPPQEDEFDHELEAIAQIFIEKERFAEALKVYDELRLANPDNLDVLETTFSLCKKIPNCSPPLKSRIEELHSFIKRNPKSTSARELLLMYAQESKDPNEAKKAIEGLVRSNPKTLAHRMLLIELYEDHREERKLDLLLADLSKLFPRSVEIWVRIAERALDRNQEKRARYALKRSRAYLPPRSKRAEKNEYRNRWMAVKRELDAKVESIYRDFRQDTRWADLEDDFVRSTYP